jgi:hypothetical protein
MKRLKTYAQTFTKIKLPHPVYDKMDELSSFNDKNVLHGMNEWIGYQSFERIYYYYLYHKYNQKCLAVSSYTIDLNFFEPRENENEFERFMNEKIVIKICECIRNNVDIMIIPVTLNIKSQGYHANLLIYRNINKTIEHFEPWGQIGPLTVFNEQFRSLISDINSNLSVNNIEITYIEAQHVCPQLDGLQRLEMKSPKSIFIKEEGYCSAWSMFFAELVLMNPTKTSRELMTEIFERFKTMVSVSPEVYLRLVIRGYVNVIKKIIEDKISILLGQPMPYAKFLDVMKNQNGIPEQREIYDKMFMWMTNLLGKEMLYLESTDKYVFLNALQEYFPDVYEKFIDFIELSPPDPSLLEIKEWKDVVPQQKSISQKKNETRKASETDYVMSTGINGGGRRRTSKKKKNKSKSKKTLKKKTKKKR